MIHTIQGDITTATGLILHVVNTQGVMGAGVAKAIKEKWPQVFLPYQIACEQGRSRNLGTYQLIEVSEDTAVVNIFAQNFYGKLPNHRYLSYDALDEALRVFSTHLDHPEIAGKDVNFPQMGSGLAGGCWEVVEQLIEYRIPDPVVKKLWLL